jgi:hypothetical protein
MNAEEQAVSSIGSSNWIRFGLGFLAVGVAAGTSGCRTAGLTAEGARVATSQTAPIDQGYPPAACRSLGYVVGRGGGTFGGAWISNDELVKYAMNDLQNEVAKRGGNYVQHDTPQMGVGGDKNGTSTTTATVSGTAYYCDPDARGATAAATLAPAASKPPALTAAPEGAGGFRFGETVAEAQSACTGGGHAWKRTGDDAECSSTLVPLGTSARATLRLCQDAVCGIELFVAEPAEKVVTKYDELYSALEKKYGIPKQRRSEVVPACQSDLKTCLSGAAAPAGAAWRWPDGNAIEVRLAALAGTPLVDLAYSNPTRTKTTTPGPAL